MIHKKEEISLFQRVSSLFWAVSTVTVRLQRNNETCEEICARVGVRSFAVTPDGGFSINVVPIPSVHPVLGISNEILIGAISQELIDAIHDLQKLCKKLDPTRLTTIAHLSGMPITGPMHPHY